MLFQYKTKQHAILASSLLSQNEIPAEIIGEKGTIKILSPWFEKSDGLELDIYNKGKIIYPCRWPGHGLHFEVAEVLTCIREGRISSDVLSHEFSRNLISVMDDIRKQIHVTYEMHE